MKRSQGLFGVFAGNALTVCVGVTTPCFAQEQQLPRGERPGIREDTETTTDRRRERLERQLAWLAQRQEAIRAEIEGLDDTGEPQGDRPPEMLGDRMPERPPSPEEVQEGIARVFSDMEPEMAQRIQQTLDEAQGAPDHGPAHRAAARIMPRLAELARLRDRDPEMYEAKRDEFRAGFAIMRAARDVLDRSDVADAEATLRRAIEDGLDAQTRVTRLELERLEQRVSEIRDRLSEAEHNREDLVGRRVRGLLDRIQRGGSIEGRSDERKPKSGDD